MKHTQEKKGRMTRAMAMWECAGVSERYPDIEYVVWYTLDKGYFVRHGRDGAQPGAKRIAVFIGGDEFFG